MKRILFLERDSREKRDWLNVSSLRVSPVALVSPVAPGFYERRPVVRFTLHGRREARDGRGRFLSFIWFISFFQALIGRTKPDKTNQRNQKNQTTKTDALLAHPLRAKLAFEFPSVAIRIQRLTDPME